MNSEHLTFEIGGRKALPVRAIPYVTGWGVGELVQYFSRKVGAPFERLQDVYAYHLLSGQPVKYLPREWDGVQTNLNALSAELHEKFINDDQGYAAWCSEAVAALPEGLFVWLDEFEKDCAVNLSPNRIIFPSERDDDRELNYTPKLTTATQEIVFAGFDELCGKNINKLGSHMLGAIEDSELPRVHHEISLQADANQEAQTLPETQIEATSTSQQEIDHDKLLSQLFDAVPVHALEKMFPANGQWKIWAERASRNGLEKARQGRAKFNPYKAGIWFMQKGNQNWDLARCHRVLKNSLPARSKYKADLLEVTDDK